MRVIPTWSGRSSSLSSGDELIPAEEFNQAEHEAAGDENRPGEDDKILASQPGLGQYGLESRKLVGGDDQHHPRGLFRHEPRHYRPYQSNHQQIEKVDRQGGGSPQIIADQAEDDGHPR